MTSPAHRTLLTAAPLALALALSLPGATALADPGSGNGGGAAQGSQGSGHGKERAERHGGGKDQGKDQGGSAGARSQASPATDSSRGQAAPSAERRRDRRAARPAARPARPGTARPVQAPAGDPRGGNGTIKIDGLPLGDGRGNEPHVGCAFAVDFWGFDAGQTADVVFTGHAPTGGGTLLVRRGVTISDDAAGGGQDRDASLLFTAAQLGLDGVAPHRNGWHVKVAVDVLEAPGGAKQKVFWLQCPSAGASPTTAAPAVGSAGAAGTVTTPAPTGTPAAGQGALGGGTATGGGGTSVVTAAGAGAATGAGAVQADGAAEPRVVAAGRGSRLLGGALPFTGGDLGTALLLGGGAVVAGVATLLGARRRGVAL